MDYAFISYSSEDRPFALKLAEDLHQKGQEIWLDQWKITGRRPYWDEIQTGIEGCSHFIFVISPDSLAQGSGARKELYHAAGLKPMPTLIPVMARTTPFQSLPIVISPGELQIHNFVDNPYDMMLERVHVALTRGGTGQIVLPVPKKPGDTSVQPASRPAQPPASNAAMQAAIDDLFVTKPNMKAPAYQPPPINRQPASNQPLSVIEGPQQSGVNATALIIGFVAAVFGIFGVSYLMTGRTKQAAIAFVGGLGWIFLALVALEFVGAANTTIDFNTGLYTTGDPIVACLFIVPIHLIAAWIVSQKGATLAPAK